MADGSGLNPGADGTAVSKRESAPGLNRVEDALSSSPPRELLIDKIDALLKDVYGTCVLSPSTVVVEHGPNVQLPSLHGASRMPQAQTN